MKQSKNKKGSILILSIMLMFVLLTLTLLMFTNEYVSRNSAIRARMSTVQKQAVEITLQRFSDTFSAKSESGKTLPVPPPSDSSGSPAYDIPFECSAEDAPDFKVKGRWRKNESIFYPPKQNAGRDFTDVPDNGYHGKVTAQGYDETDVPPWHNLVVLKSPLKTAYIAAYAHHFPYGAFAPKGKINLKDAYGFINPVEDKRKKGDYFSGIPVDIYAKTDIELEEFPHGRAYSETGTIKTGKIRGGLSFTSVTGRRAKEATRYSSIIRKQLDNLSDNIVKVTLKKNNILFGRKITDVISFATTTVPDEFITVEQTAGFPFGGMTVNSNNPREKTMGNYYTFNVYPPSLPDRDEIFQIDTSNITKAYNLLDDVMKIFNGYKILWKIISTDKCLTAAEILLGKDIAVTSAKLAAAIAALKPVKAALYAAKLAKLIIQLDRILDFSKYYNAMQSYESRLTSHTRGRTKDEPETVEQDRTYSNSGWPYIRVCAGDNIQAFARILIQNGNSKYNNLGVEVVRRTTSQIRLSHFGKGSFISNWKKINSDDFIFAGTYIIPRGRTLNFSGNVTIEGDLWIQDGAALYVGGNLTLKIPSKTSDLPDMVKPSGRMFLGTGSSVIVEKDITCKGSIPLGSVVLSSPHKKVNEITSVIYSKQGSVNIPYGITPGISVDELAKISSSQLSSHISENLKSLMDNSANIAKAAGPFHFRKSFFAYNAATLTVFRHKNLGNSSGGYGFRSIVMPDKHFGYNFMNDLFTIFTESFTYYLNIYLGENFLTDSDWWIFGAEVVPILPKMEPGKVAEYMSGLKDISGALEQLQTAQKDINLILASDTPLKIVDASKTASRETASVYSIFFRGSFGSGNDDRARSLISGILNKARQAYQPFSQIIASMDRAKNTYASAVRLFSDFYKNAYPSMKNHLPGGDDPRTFIECPGILIYAEKDINLGTEETVPSGTVFPASGFFIANRDVKINGSFRLVGSLMSLEGNISAKDTCLRYYPYFSLASIYLPKDVGGDLNKNMKLVGDADLKSGSDPCNVGITIPRIVSEGWIYYSE